MTAAEIVRRLDLRPHPEGGWYRETFRDAAGADGRARSTAIYYLLEAGQRSHWHRIDAVEVWHVYAGAPLTLRIAQPGAATETVTLGSDLAKGEQPQAVVPAGFWQAAESLGAFTLAGCTVAPGFAFDGFELAPPGFSPT
jgi:predicted cupin superfamily sugar epimerase